MLDTPLQELPRSMAHAIRPLYSAPTRSLYAAYLQQMLHYTKFAGDELRHAAQLAQQAPLQQLLSGLASEEESHYRLAEHDLRSQGIAISPQPSASVLAYRDFWSNIGTQQAWSFAGALYVLENVARYAGPEALAALAPLQLQSSETHFVRAHLVADDAHGDRVHACCEHGFAQHSADILAGAHQASKLWVAMHLAVLTA
jgi:hypothetical protein